MPVPVLIFAAIAAAVTIAGFAGVDLLVARAVSPSPALDWTVGALEVVTLKHWSEFILPLVLAIVGGALWAMGRSSAGRAALYIGAVQLTAYLASDLSKPQFGRLRPFEALEHGGGDAWFSGGNSFPSGHASYFAGLAVPLVMLFPRAWPLLFLPLLVAAERVTSADHYLSDVCAAFVLAALTAWAFRPIAMSPRAELGGELRRA